MSIDVLISDMALRGDPLLNAPQNAQWTVRARCEMGKDSRGTATPVWWVPQDQNLKTSYRWTNLSPWWVLYEGVGNNQLANTRCQLRNLRLQILRLSSMSWQTFINTSDYGADNFDAAAIFSSGVADQRPALSGGGREFKMPTGNQNNIHGWGLTPFTVDVSPFILDIGNVCVSIEARLTLDNPSGPDQRSQSRITLGPGLDWYPYNRALISDMRIRNSSAQWNPGSGGGRYKLLSNEWQRFYFCPVFLPWGQAEYDRTASVPLSERTVTEAFLRAYPPDFAGAVTPPTGTFSIIMPPLANEGAIVPVFVRDATNAPVSGASVAWDGASGGLISGNTNSVGVSTITTSGSGAFRVRATSGANSANAQLTVTTTEENLLQNSEDISGVWEFEGTGNLMSLNSVPDIYGTTRFDLWTQGSNTPSLRQIVTSGVGTNPRLTGSAFFVRGSHDWVQMRVLNATSNRGADVWFNIGNGTQGSQRTLGGANNLVAGIERWASNIYRAWVSVDMPNETSGTGHLQIRVDSGDFAFNFPAGATVGVGGMMLNEGNLIPYISTNAVLTPPVIQFKSLTQARTGLPYGEEIVIAGSTPVTWSIISGGLPPGITSDASTATGRTLTLSSTGVTATTGTTFTVRAVNSQGQDVQEFTLPVIDPDNPVAPTTDVGAWFPKVTNGQASWASRTLVVPPSPNKIRRIRRAYIRG